jgi:uncharacterized glyoxalase superfamily protein PhnB
MSAMARARLDAVGVVVTDLARSVQFYRELGVPFEAGAEQSEHDHAEATLEGGVRLMLDTEAGMKVFDAAWKRASGGAPSVSLAFHCASPGEVDELYARALALGGRAHKEPWDAFWGQRYAQLRDPYGNGVDLYAELNPAR